MSQDTTNKFIVITSLATTAICWSTMAWLINKDRKTKKKWTSG